MKAYILKKMSTMQIPGNTSSEITIEVDHTEEGTLADPQTPITGEQIEVMTENAVHVPRILQTVMDIPHGVVYVTLSITGHKTVQTRPIKTMTFLVFPWQCKV